MLIDIRTAISTPRPENRDFCVKREALTVSTLRMQGFVKKAEKASRLFWFEKKEMRFFQNYQDTSAVAY